MRLAELKPSLFVASLGATLLLALSLLLAWSTGWQWSPTESAAVHTFTQADALLQPEGLR